MRVLAVDPAFKNTGYVVFESGESEWIPLACRVIRPKTLSGKQLARAKMGKIAHNRNRCVEIFTELLETIQRYDVGVLVAEELGGTQSSAAARGFGMSDAILACVVEVAKIEAYWYSNKAIKKVFTGIVDSDKNRMVLEACKKWPDFTEEHFPEGKAILRKYAQHAEHLADAMAVMTCAERTDNLLDIFKDS